jgi:c-di-AMP phosphodiesterase-like protein
MSFSKLIYTIAALIVGVWLLGIIFRFAAWLVSGMLYIALFVFIIGLILQFGEQQRLKKRQSILKTKADKDHDSSSK